MAFRRTSAIGAPIAATLLALALGGCGDASSVSTADETAAQQLNDLARACTRYDELEAAIQAIRDRQVGAPRPLAAGDEILVDRLPHCPHVPHRPLRDILKELLGPEPRRGSVPESRAAELEQAAARAAAEVEQLAARVHPRL